MEATMSGQEAYDQLMARAKKVMKITLGALIEYFKSPEFAELSEEQKDNIFSMVVTTWATLLPEPAGAMWDELVITTAYDAHARGIMEQKEAENDADTIAKGLGWNFPPDVERGETGEEDENDE